MDKPTHIVVTNANRKWLRYVFYKSIRLGQSLRIPERAWLARVLKNVRHVLRQKA